ncbi:MAG TPA: hypothetical protein H9768_01075 [Candidatus Mailhella merdavium]|nr:hypothetical protein [Candidatus Mailhella merdavium]
MSRDPLIKVYASLYPVDAAALDAVNAVLAAWYVEGAAELNGDLLLISHEGEYFPTEDVVAALKPFLRDESRGKLDELDLEAWTLRRWFFDYGRLMMRKASLDQALESCGTK